MSDDSNVKWVKSEQLKFALGGQIAVFCNRHGNIACLHFVKDFKCQRNFYCSVEMFEQATKEQAEINMFDEYENRLRVRPNGFHNYNSFFYADDLISAGLFVQEIKSLRENKN